MVLDPIHRLRHPARPRDRSDAVSRTRIPKSLSWEITVWLLPGDNCDELEKLLETVEARLATAPRPAGRARYNQLIPSDARTLVGVCRRMIRSTYSEQILSRDRSPRTAFFIHAKPFSWAAAQALFHPGSQIADEAAHANMRESHLSLWMVVVSW